MVENPRRSPFVCAGIFMGAGLGGFADGIIFHQILQWHHVFSALIPPNDVVTINVNMFWDGVFHAAVWVLTAIGLALLWRAGQRRDIPSWPGRTFFGSLMAGWGLFNVVEGLIDHQFLGLHHVDEYAEQTLFGDMAFLLFGVAMLIGGWRLIGAGRKDTLP